MDSCPGLMLTTADERDVAIDIADGLSDGDRAEARPESLQNWALSFSRRDGKWQYR